MSRVGEDGVTLALELRPDLLVLNVPLPDMTWAEAVRRVRALDGLALVRSTSPHHQARVGHPPIILAVDRGFSTRNNEASGAGRRRADRRVAPFGLVTSELRYFEHRASF